MGKFLKYLSPVLLFGTLGLVAWAIFTTPEDPTVANATAVGGNLYWAYGIFAVSVVVALFAALWDLAQKPEGLKGSIFGLLAIVAIVVVAYVLANGHDYQIVDLGNQGFFERGETVITDASIIVAYVAGAGAILAAIYSAVTDALK